MQDVILSLTTDSAPVVAISAVVQAVSIVALVCLTAWYAYSAKRQVKETRRLADLPQQRQQKHALRAICDETDAIHAACHFRESDIRPVELPTHNYDTWIAAMLGILPDEQRRTDLYHACLALYAQVRACNARYDRWRIAPGRGDQSTDPTGVAAGCWQKERDRLGALLAAFRQALRGAESPDHS